MKTEEDEAFDDLAKRQGSWGGGFPAKRKMVADKLQEFVPSDAFERWWYYEGSAPPYTHHDCEEHTKRMCQIAWSNGAYVATQPAQKPVNLLEARKIAAEYGMPDSQVDDGNLYFALSKCLEHIDAQPAQEPRNVRERWNVELDGNDLLVCFNDHEKGDKCQYERYSPQLQWIWLSDADIAEVVDTTCQYTGSYEEYLIKKAERKIRSINNE
jgi:hypothetical protein